MPLHYPQDLNSSIFIKAPRILGSKRQRRKAVWSVWEETVKWQRSLGFGENSCGTSQWFHRAIQAPAWCTANGNLEQRTLKEPRNTTAWPHSLNPEPSYPSWYGTKVFVGTGPLLSISKQLTPHMEYYYYILLLVATLKCLDAERPIGVISDS